MKTIDRVLRDGIRPTQSEMGSFNGVMVETFRRDSAVSLKDGSVVEVPQAKVIVADDVAAWGKTLGGEKALGDYGRLTPPWYATWIEYPSASGNERRATWTLSERQKRLDDYQGIAGTNKTSWWTELANGACDDAKAEGLDLSGSGHIAVSVIYVEARKRVHGPIGAYCMVLDDDGFMQGNRWMDFSGMKMPIPFEDWMIAAIAPTFDTFELLHMRNVSTAEHVPEARRRDRKHGRLPPVRYSTLRLHLPRQANRGGTGTGAGISPGQHIVAGHVAHYGDCCPGVHAPNGKLFGKLAGVYWVPSFIRGSEGNGTVVTDLEVVRD